ncbi:carboxypeptidase regulatory-like domain-containing protein [Lewinella sp. JB7]|uniref:TonB-dependent receptor n=1 Tax=Lewinella sp. JB7 TaxID=2962887 RepID=UPI0020CA043E|nr:carboxypeptidase regulatory-like domain-containing protein [Lewinella sp. JB7]MCP9237577.1 carboxypeptidase regulatory-like domain-containing protein [Lewinella sp. JB7]
MRFFTNLLTICLVLMLLPLGVAAQGVTTSSIYGQITEAGTGEPLIGATVQAVHTPSGTTYGNVTDLEGFFRLPGLRVGGPYTISVTYTGFSPIVQDDIFLSLGQAFQFSQSLSEGAVDLGEITVTSTRGAVFDGKRTGQETTISEQQIDALPTVNRNIADYARLNPLAKIEEGDGFAIQIAGQNNRFNSIYIDGAVNNDAFGLSGSGTNGGQTGVSPISIDAVEQFTVAVAPFDVRQSGFAGGSISAVTRSGTNNLEGSAYYFFRNDGLTRDAGFTNDVGFDFDPIAEFSAKTYGARLGGPIIKDKVFFFVNAELQRDETPQPFSIANYQGNSSAGDLSALANTIRNTYGYDPGAYDNNTAYLNSDKLLGKLDFNLSDVHKLSVRHSYVTAENLEARNSGSRNINFLNGSEFFISKTNSSAVELNSLFGNSANNLTIGFTSVRDDRDPLGPDFPTLRLQDGNNGNIELGAERFSTANLLNQDILTIKNDYTIYAGRHNVLVGANLEYFKAGNLFIRENFGSYQYFDSDSLTGVQRFLAGEPADQFDRSYSQVDNITGDGSAAIATIKQTLIGFYVQDEFQVNDQLRLTGGLRIDVPVWPNDVPENDQFNSETIPLLDQAGYDLEGARTGQFIKSSILFSPRLGFNYDVLGDKTLQLRGGIGIFTSRIPLVWPGGAYNNYGFNIGGVRLRDEVMFNPDVNSQPPGDINLSNPAPSGQIDLFAQNFKLPQTTKVNLAVDYQLPHNFILTVEGLYTKFNNYVRYQSLNLDPSNIARLTGTPDNRVYYTSSSALDRTYTGIYLGTNTDKGYSWNFSTVLQKPFSNGFIGTLGYSYGDSYSLFDGTSSQNSSQWRSYYNPEGRNNEGPVQRSAFAAGHRIFGSASYAFEGTENTKQTFSIFMNGDSRGAYTYVVGASNRDFVNDFGFSFNEVAFIPANASEINLVEDRNGNSPATQYAALEAFIEDDPYLKDNRGQFAERNSNWSPFKTIFDARFLQDFYINTKNGHRNTLQLSLDVFNLNNLLNKQWGQINSLGFGTYSLVNLDDISDDGVPTYTVNSEIVNGAKPDEIFDDNLDDSGLRSSRWTMQLGVRYTFK